MKRAYPDLLAFDGDIDVIAADKEGDSQSKFFILAYTGRPMLVAQYFDPVIIDVAGVKFANKKLPIIADHNPALRVGHAVESAVIPAGGNAAVDGRNVKGPAIALAGVVSSSMNVAKAFVNDSKAGFPFQASVGARILKGEYIEDGEKVEVNGKAYKGPLIVARETLIRETSVLTLGADDRTVSVAASVAASQYARGVPIDENSPPTNKLKSPEGTKPMPDDLTAHRQKLAAESRRIDAINAAFSQFSRPQKITHEGQEFDRSTFKAHAIEQGLTQEAVELALFRSNLEAQAPEFPAIHFGSGPSENEVVEAAIARHVGSGNLESHYESRVLNLADRLPVRHIMDVALMYARQSGQSFVARDSNSVLKAALGNGSPLTTLLSNVANKSVLDGYNAFPSVARAVARKLDANDFKAATGIKITGDATFLEVNGGEIKNVSMGDQSFTYQLGTYGRMWELNRQSIINDDTGELLNAVPSGPLKKSESKNIFSTWRRGHEWIEGEADGVGKATA